MSSNTIHPFISYFIDILRRNDDSDTTIVFRLSDNDLKLNDAEMEGVADALSSNTKVSDMNFDGCGVGRGTFISSAYFLNRAFSTHPSLTSLDIRFNCLNDDHAICIAESLKTNTSLNKLDLDGNRIGNKGFLALMKALRENKTLEELDLRINNITMEEDGAIDIAVSIEKSSMKTLNLSQNKLGQKGAVTIASGLKKNKTITKLNIAIDEINVAGCQALASALRHNATLRELGMSLNAGADDAGVRVEFEYSLRHVNYNIEVLHINYHNISPKIDTLCAMNRRLKQTIQQIRDALPQIPLGLWPRVLELVESKPDYLYQLLKAKPEMCRDLQRRNSRRRTRPERWGY